MRVVFISACFPSEEKPYYCIYLEQQAKALAAMGIGVEILIPTYEGEPGSLQRSEYHGLPVTTIGLKRSRGNQICTTPENRRILKEYFREGIDVVSVHLVSAPLAVAVAEICCSRGIAVVMHYHGLNVWSEYAPEKSLLHRLLRCHYNQQTRRLLKLCRGAVGVSERTCREISRKMPGVRTFCVYNGVDAEVFYPRQEALPREIFRVICVANLIPIKGQRYLLEALPLLPETVLLTLVGIGPEEQKLRMLAQELGVSHRVEFTGALPYPAVAEKMRQSHMFIMPSCYEAFGCVFAEAMSAGLLTCGCEDTGADEIITHGSNGLLLPQKDGNAIADAVRFAMTDPRAGKLALQGRSRAAELSWANSAKTLMEVYRAIL